MLLGQHQHENSREIKLNLETDVNVCAIDSRTPPKSETTIGDLVQTRPLGIRQLLVAHRFFETRSFLPEQPFPSWKISSFEKGMLKDSLDTTKCGNNIDAIIVQLP
jgi:hypothetical protein